MIIKDGDLSVVVWLDSWGYSKKLQEISTTYGFEWELWKSHAGHWYWPRRETSPYRKWHPGEPNDATGVENCTEMYLGGIEEWQLGKWNDTTCGLERRFVCEQVDLD